MVLDAALFYFRPLPLLLKAAAMAALHDVFSPLFPGAAWLNPELKNEAASA